MQHIQIILDNFDGTCYPGQTISGRVECNFDEETKCRAIKIRFKGRARTHFSVRHNKNTTRYSGEEIYFLQEFILASGQEELILPVGKHMYPFSYILPQRLPSSFEGLSGNVKYSITAIVDRPWKTDYDYKMYLSVASLLDLNYLPNLRAPFRGTNEKTVCCWCCKSGPIEFEVTLPMTGYVPDQDVNVNSCVKNMSNVNIEAVKFTVLETIQYIAHFPHTRDRLHEDRIFQFSESGIGAHGEKTWTTNFKLPLNQYYPNLTPCNIININYILRIELVLPTFNSNLDVEIPITIGNVALSAVNFAPPNPPPTNFPSYSAVPNPSVPPSYGTDFQQYGSEGGDASKPFLT